jgi:hypothetical protein
VPWRTGQEAGLRAPVAGTGTPNNSRGKAVYLDILQAGCDRIPAGGLVLAHNSVNCADRQADYLANVRTPAYFRASVNVIIDGEGLEISAR